jgi:hypothetical protein
MCLWTLITYLLVQVIPCFLFFQGIALIGSNQELQAVSWDLSSVDLSSVGVGSCMIYCWNEKLSGAYMLFGKVPGQTPTNTCKYPMFGFRTSVVLADVSGNLVLALSLSLPAMQSAFLSMTAAPVEKQLLFLSTQTASLRK